MVYIHTLQYYLGNVKNVNKYCNMGEPSKYYPKWGKPGLKGYMARFHSYDILIKVKSIEMAAELPVAKTGNGIVNWFKFLEWWNGTGWWWRLYNFKFTKLLNCMLTVFPFWHVSHISVNYKSVSNCIFMLMYLLCIWVQHEYSFYFFYSH